MKFLIFTDLDISKQEISKIKIKNEISNIMTLYKN